tara:strand:+ start:5938 stop:7086 length:1149 start_codon:yes stop_codon:yes gene_type:complete
MKKQKICVIGSGLSGLTSALLLSNLNLEIDLYFSKKDIKKASDKRTTAISQSNLDFLRKKIKLSNRIFWPCDKVNLFFQNNNDYTNFLNLKSDKGSLMYIFENNKFKLELFNQIKLKKNINLINKKVLSINHEQGYLKIKKNKVYYDQFILSLGFKSNLYEKILDGRSISKDYKEIAITGYIKHNEKITNPSQYFLKEGPFAILPFKKNYFSFVWTIDKKFIDPNKNYLKNLVKDKIYKFLKIKKKYFLKDLNFYPVYLNLPRKYFKKNFLILGEGLHSIHPIAGQGFNLILRDIKSLYEIYNHNLKLGLLLKNSFALKEFYNERKAENLFLGLGVDLTNSFFKYNKVLNPLKLLAIKNINKFKGVAKISKLISDKGLYSNY